MRWERFLPALAAAGFQAEVREIPERSRGSLWKAAPAFDLVVLHRRLLGALDFRRLRRAARRLVYDFDDALLYREHPPHRSLRRQARFFRSVRGADVVFAGNRVLAGYARLAARRVHVLPSTVDVEALRPGRPGEGFVAVWIGQRATLPYLEGARAAILRAGEAIPGFRLRVIADEAPPGVEFLHWTPDNEGEGLATAHVGLMPLPDDPWTRGKCGYKLLQYYAAGLPAVASPVGVNRSLAEGGGALLARTPEEWAGSLRRLAGDAELRARLGAQGRGFVARRYASASLTPRLIELLRSAAQP